MTGGGPQLLEAICSQQLPHEFKGGYRHCTCEQLAQASKPGARAWRNTLDFVLGYSSCLFRSSGIYLYFSYCLKYGGLSFSVAYFTVMMTFGLPTVVLLAAVGQLTRFGTLRCWGFCPAIKGIGVAIMLMSALRTVPNMVVASEGVFVAIVLLESFGFYSGGAGNVTCCSSPLQSGFCNEIKFMKFDGCYDRDLRLVSPDWGICGELNYKRVLYAGKATLQNHYLWKKVGVIDRSNAKDSFAANKASLDSGLKLPTTDLLNGRMRRGFRADSGAINKVHWTLLSFVFTLAYCCLLLMLMVDDATLRTAMYCLSLFSSTSLVIINIVSLCLLSDGPSIFAGLKQFFRSPVNLHLTNNLVIWVDAVLLVLWNTGCASGEIIGMTKMNQFGQDFIRPTMLSLAVHCLANTLHVMVQEIIFEFVNRSRGTDLRMEAHGFTNILMELQPYMLSSLSYSLSVSPLLCFAVGEVCDIVAFLCCCVESLSDVWPRLRAWSGMLYILLFCVLFGLCMPLCYEFGGSAVYNFLYASFSWNCLILLTVLLGALLSYLGPTGVLILFRHLGLSEQFNGLTFWWQLCWFFYTPLLLLLSCAVLAYESVTFALGRVGTSMNKTTVGPLFNLSKNQLQGSLYPWWVLELLRAATLLPVAVMALRHGLLRPVHNKLKKAKQSESPDEDGWGEISADLQLLRKRQT